MTQIFFDSYTTEIRSSKSAAMSRIMCIMKTTKCLQIMISLLSVTVFNIFNCNDTGVNGHSPGMMGYIPGSATSTSALGDFVACLMRTCMDPDGTCWTSATITLSFSFGIILIFGNRASCSNREQGGSKKNNNNLIYCRGFKYWVTSVGMADKGYRLSHWCGRIFLLRRFFWYNIVHSLCSFCSQTRRETWVCRSRCSTRSPILKILLPWCFNDCMFWISAGLEFQIFKLFYKK